MKNFVFLLGLALLFSGCNIESGSSSTTLESQDVQNGSSSNGNDSGTISYPKSYIGNGSSVNDAVQDDSVPVIPLEDLGLSSFN
jgi:hypothetical protein